MLPAVAAGLVTGGFNLAGGLLTNNSNARQAEMNRDFQREMSNTAWQRGVADMKAAGLNPALAYEKGPASSPAGSTAQLENPARSASEAAVNAAGAATSASAVKAQNARAVADTELALAQAARTRAETGRINLLTNAEWALMNAQTNQASAGSDYTRGRLQTENLMRQLGYERGEAELKGVNNQNAMFGIERALKVMELLTGRQEYGLRPGIVDAQMRLMRAQSDQLESSTAGQWLQNGILNLQYPGYINDANFERGALGPWKRRLSTAKDAAAVIGVLGGGTGLLLRGLKEYLRMDKNPIGFRP